uniref:Uncharacterized protein n=1 Tax=Rhizophora mucronata TaxID=61149 RepID=A0A2P2QSW9_RHIMU
MVFLGIPRSTKSKKASGSR